MSSLIEKTKVGVIWSLIEKVSVQLVSFLINIIIARLLSPHDYGVIGLLTIFTSFSNVFIDSGFSRALIQKINRTENDFSTALIFNVLMGIVLYVIMYIFSPSIAGFYKTPELVNLQRAFFIVLILNSLTVVQNAKFHINIDFKNVAVANFIAIVFAGFVGIFAALKGWGPWALVAQALTRSTSLVILFWLIGKWVPRTGFSVSSFRGLFAFGSKLLATGLISTGISNIEWLIIGKYYNPSNLGYYTRAQQFPELTAGTLANVLNNATFPLLASMQQNKQQLVPTFKKIIRITALFIFPIMTGIAILSKDIIIILLGYKWLPASDLLFWLTFSYIFTPLSILNLSVLNAIGRSDLFLKVDLVKIPFILITMFITFPISLKAVVIGKCMTSFLYFFINGYVPGKLFGYDSISQLLSAWKAIIATIIMAVVIVIVKTYIDQALIRLFACIILGIVTYLLVLVILKEELLRVFLGKRKATA